MTYLRYYFLNAPVQRPLPGWQQVALKTGQVN